MKRFRCLLIYLVPAPAVLFAQNAPLQPLYTIDLSKFVSQEMNVNPAGTLTFLTDKVLAVSICRNLRCNLVTFDLGSGKPRIIATRTDEFPHYSSLFRTSDARVILDNASNGTGRGAVILDSQLRPQFVIPKAAGIRQSYLSTTGETFVDQGVNDWVACKMERPTQRLLAGTGRVLSVSDEAVAYVKEGAVHIDGLDGKPLGSFTVMPRAFPTIRFLGHDYLWSESGSKVEILDFKGKAIRTFDRPDGWGFRIGQSSDGNRILYDRYTRHIPATQKIEEIAAAILVGDAGDEVPNGEMALVIDTSSGKPCFEWNSNTNLLVAGQFHADIDPSGRLVAIMTPTALNIYQLPEVCVAK